MTKWQPIKFADVKVGDTIKSVSPCGTVRVGVVTTRTDISAKDANGLWLATYPSSDAWPTYRRAPKFTPLNVPAVGQWGEFTLRDGRVIVAEVTSVDDWSHQPNPCWDINVLAPAKMTLFINGSRKTKAYERDIISWRPATPPAPEEPSGFGYVGDIETGGVYPLQVWRTKGYNGCPAYTAIRANGNDRLGIADWSEVVNLGTFTAVTR